MMIEENGINKISKIKIHKKISLKVFIISLSFNENEWVNAQ